MAQSSLWRLGSVSALLHKVMENEHECWSETFFIDQCNCGLQVVLSIELAEEVDVPGPLDADFLWLRLAVSFDVD